jgi:putative SOS response-associated peptidase YedK
MCGRYVIKAPVSQLATMFDLIDVPPLKARYNVAPTQSVPAVREKAEGKGRELVMLKWGLIPGWAKDPAIGYRMINARADTVSQKPSYRSAFRRRRCLLAADGFYEWQKTNEKKKQPFFIGMKDESPFAFAGMWEHWVNPEGEPVESCAIITTDANELVKEIHDRMPVILPRKNYQVWLDPEVQDTEKLQKLLVQYPAKEMRAYPVSLLVNNPKVDNANCVAPLEITD